MAATALSEVQPHALESDNDADGDHEDDHTLPPDLNIPIPKIDDTYGSFDELRHAVNAWSLRDNFMARCSKKDTTRAQYKCRLFERGCQWAVRATISRSTGLLTITSVSPEHTCEPPDVWMNHEGIAQRGKRAVHATQRWVVDTLKRLGYKPHVRSDPKEIVKLIEERCGTKITEKLAYKSRDRMLSSMGVQPPLPHGRGGRPDQVAQRKRMREAEAAMAQQRSEERTTREQETFGSEIDPGTSNLQPDSRDFVFESGYRILGPVPDAPNAQGVPFIRSDIPHHATDTGLSLPQAPPAPSAPPPQPVQNTRACVTCGGTGFMPLSTATLNGTTRNVNSQPPLTALPPRDEELSLMKQQIALLAKQIELMQKRRGTAG